ncbi:MAG: ABC transporter permease [Holophaga sp.]|nr:ABC transporter permease [Holophaga sp.]
MTSPPPAPQDPTDELGRELRPVSPWADAWRRLRRNRMALAGLVVVACYALFCLGAPVLPIHPYAEQVVAHENLPPSLRPAGELMLAARTGYLQRLRAAENRAEPSAEERTELADMARDIRTQAVHRRHYWLGTDELGRDMLSRLLYGGRISILIGLVGTVTSMLLGVALGSIAGYAGGTVDNLIMRFVDILYGLPYMLLVIIMMALFGRNILNLFVAVALVSWLTLCRVVRGQVISLKHAEFVEAARSMGASPARIIFRHLTPNTLGVIVVFSTLLVPQFIMTESFLSFLGLGVSAPLASWGSLVAEGAGVMSLYPWQLLGPAVAMTVFLFAMNFLGDGLRDALDPQGRRGA